jgi:hypothetical protein
MESNHSDYSSSSVSITVAAMVVQNFKTASEKQRFCENYGLGLDMLKINCFFGADVKANHPIRFRRTK